MAFNLLSFSPTRVALKYNLLISVIFTIQIYLVCRAANIVITQETNILFDKKQKYLQCRVEYLF